MEKKKLSCNFHCEYLIHRQEEYDSELIGYCNYCKKMEHIGTMDSINNKECECLYDRHLVELKSISKMGKNWNDNGAEGFSPELIQKCIFFENHLVFEHEIFPTACESIQFEFDFNNIYIEVELFDEKIEVFIKNNVEEKEFKYSNDISGVINVLNLLKYYYSKKVEDIAVFSGAFNPPTKAHHHVMKRVLEKKNFSFIVVALANEKFLNKKQSRNKDISFSEKDRLLMMLSMTYDNPKILIYGIEDGYTFEILSNVKDKFVDKKVYFIAGSDKVKQIPKWGFGDKLLKEFGFIILTRGDELEIINNNCKAIFKTYKLINTSTYENISATKVREALRNKTKYKDMVHKNVSKVLEDIKGNYFK